MKHDARVLLDAIREHLIYDREQGKFFQRGRRGIPAGAEFGCPAGKNARQGTFLGRRYQVSHLVWLVERGCLPEGRLYHRNGDAHDCRIENLTEDAPKPASERFVECETHGRVRISKRRSKKRGCPRCGNERAIEAARQRRKSPEEKLEVQRAYQRAHRELYRESRRRHYRATRQDPRVRAATACRAMVTRVMRAVRCLVPTGVSRRLGYTVEEFKDHIEAQFEPWMTWANHGEWHVDHVKPIAWFIRQGIYDPKQINALSNLRPLRAVDNLCRPKDGRDEIAA